MDKLLIVNDIIKFTLNNRMERILWINYKCNLCITIELETNHIHINQREISDIIDGIEDKIIKLLVEDTNFYITNNENISNKNKELLEKSWEIVQFIASEEKEPDVLIDKKFRRMLVVQAKEKFERGDKVIYKYLRKYWQGGKVKTSLLSGYYKCGGRGKRKVLGEKKVGRPNKISIYLKKLNDFSISKLEKEMYYKNILGEEINLELQSIDKIIDIYNGVNITEEHKKNIDTAIKRYYLNSKELPLTKVYELMIKEFYSYDVNDNDDLNKNVIAFNKIPTFEAFKKYYYKNYRNKENVIDEVINLRKGKKNYNLKARPIKSNSTFEAFGPGFRYQIDATIPGIYIRNRIKDSIVGKATLYFVIDVFSRLIVGIYVGIDNPSWQSASTALFNCIEDKVEFCERYGITITNNEWPQSTLPKNLLGDRGELVGLQPEKIVDTLKINIENTASWRAEQKGVVEQSFNLAEEKIKHWIPGTIKSEYRKRGERDYRLDAVLNIDELTKIFIRAVLHHNNKLMLEYPLSKEMIKDGIKPIPTEIWKWGLKNISGSLKSLPKEFVIMNLMKKKKAVITEKGIRFGRQYYDCSLANQKGWYSRARIFNYSEIDCYYDERNMNVIYILNNDTNKLESCTIMSEYEAYKGKTYHEIVEYQKMRDVEYIMYKDKVNQNDVNLNLGIEKDIIEAKKTCINTKGYVKDMKINRIVEREEVSKEQALCVEKQEEFIKDRKKIDVEVRIENNEISKENTLLSRLNRARKGIR
ncbi:hypothetical protein ACXATD_000848 [Clostridium sporogenes]